MLRTASLAALLVGAPLAAQVSPTPARPDSARPAATVAAPAGMAGAMDTTGVRRDTAIVPVADQGRGVDAEIRTALFELMEDRYIPALSRLQWLAASPVALTDAAAGGVLRGREDLLFLLSQAYYRLGMDSAFRAAATTLTSGTGAARYGRLLQSQLLLDAYRHREFERAMTLASSLDASERGLGSLVAGLSAYQLGNTAVATQHFATARAAGAPYGQYAQYMEALSMLRADTTKRGEALTALEALASSATGELQDQVRLTAAQLAYEAEQYDVASRLATQINPTSGLAAQALLTRAWALYKSNDIAAAGQAFDEFATKYPQLPERDEARLMSAQALLQLGRTQDAGNVFRTVADAAVAETGALQARAQTSMNDAARALVQARAAGLLFIGDPAIGKTVALEDAAGSERQVLVAAFSDSVTAALPPAVAAADIISLDDITRRIDAVAPDAQLPRRVVFAPASATKNPADFAKRAQALYSADIAVVVAQHELAELMASQQRQIQLLKQMQQQLTADAASFGTLASRLAAARDSLARLSVALDAASTRLRQMFAAQISTTRMLAAENRAAIDSVKSSLSGAQSAQEFVLLDLEVQTAAYYAQVADLVEQGIDGALGRHPVFARRDSLNARSNQLATLLTENQGLLATAQQQLAAEIARLEGSDSDRLRAMRGQLAAAESRRAAAETAVIAVVDAELRARAGEMIAGLRRDTEAAEFGSASASFFQAIDAGNATAGTSSSSNSGAGSPVVVAPPGGRDTPQQQRK